MKQVPLTLDMDKKNTRVSVDEAAFNVENNAITLLLSVINYDLSGKTVTGVFKQTGVETPALPVTEDGTVLLQITPNLVEAGVNYFCLHFRDADSLEQSPVIRWNLLEGFAGAASGQYQDLIANVITQINELQNMKNPINDTDLTSATTTLSAVKITEIAETKVAKAAGKGLSTNDYTMAEKEKLAGINGYVNNAVSGLIDDTSSSTDKTYSSAKILAQIANSIANLVDTAPSTLDTLNELAEALGNDPNFATTVTNLIATKVTKEDGKGLSANDYSNADKAKVDKLISLPVGTIISYMGLTAPESYIILDGTVYNIADYPALAEHFLSQLDSSNYFGGDGVTTFAVPDMREAVGVGIGTNSTFSIASHDVYTLGQFKDDQIQQLTGRLGAVDTSRGSFIASEFTGVFKNSFKLDNYGADGSNTRVTVDFDSANSPAARVGNNTRTKQLGVLYCIKYQ